jgi:hypothetical protein
MVRIWTAITTALAANKETSMRRILSAALAATIVTAFCTTAPAQAGGEYLLEDYVAYIGPDDLFNSSGVRLTTPWAVIRQDRSNFHRFGIVDRLDQGDAFFASEANRATMEQMLRAGFVSPRAARDVVTGGVLIHVEIYGRGSLGRSVNVEVAQ